MKMQKVFVKSKSDINELHLWEAAGDGDLKVVQAMLRGGKVDVNWAGHEKGDRPLHRACRFGKLEIVRRLLEHPAIEPNLANTGGASPFYIACQEGHLGIVSLLLADPRVDPAQTEMYGATSLFCPAALGDHKMVSMLLADSRINPGKPSSSGITPLWMALNMGQLIIVQLLLASWRPIDVTQKPSFTPKSPAEQARALTGEPRQSHETEADLARKEANGLLIANLIDEYHRDPVTVMLRLRKLPVVRDHFINLTFALVVFHADNFLEMRADCPLDPQRFFRICAQLPLDLQMVVCHRMFGSPKNIVLSFASEPGFKWLARPTTWT